MTAYVPSGVHVVAWLALAMLVPVTAGPWLARRRPLRAARAAAWALLLVGTAGVERSVAHEAPGVRMLALVGFALLAMKVIVLVEHRGGGGASLGTWGWLAFALAWPGMRPRPFSERGTTRPGGAGRLALQGLLHFALGVSALALARLAWTGVQSRLLASVALLAGSSLMLHFGVCNGVAALWRARGVSVDALFRAPWRSRSLAEFWARRWNVAFSEMTSSAVYRPLAASVGRRSGVLGGFVLSGLLHEMAISLPVRAGFGAPLLYFVLHGGLVLLEPALARRGPWLLGWRGRAWTFFWLLVPLPLLFHRAFLSGVVWPLIGMPPEAG